MKANNDKTIIPKWATTKIKQKLPDGNIVAITGQNRDDVCIIVKDPNDNTHATFVIKPDTYELHFTHEPSKKRKSEFELYSVVVSQLTEYWMKKQPNWIHTFSAKGWNKNYYIVNINPTELPTFRLQGYDMNPNDAKHNAIPKDKISRMKFKNGLAFDNHGRCQGMLCAQRKYKRLIFVERRLLENIVDTCIGMSDMIDRLTDDYNQFRKNV